MSDGFSARCWQMASQSGQYSAFMRFTNSTKFGVDCSIYGLILSLDNGVSTIWHLNLPLDPTGVRKPKLK